MSNMNEHKNYGSKVSQESYKDANGNTHTNVTKTTETVNNVPDNNSYNQGYVQGQVTESRYQEEVLTERDNNNAARGLIIGALLTSLAALTAGTIWYFNQSNEALPDPATPVVVPAPNTNPSPEAQQAPEKETTIIEKTRDVPVPVLVPQQQSPAPQPSAPAAQQDVNITVPSAAPQAPAPEVPATQPAPTQPQSQGSSSDTPDSQSNTDTAPESGASTNSNGSSSSSTGAGGTGSSAP